MQILGKSSRNRRNDVLFVLEPENGSFYKMKKLFSIVFFNRKCFLRVLLLGALIFLFYQFYGAIILWQYPLTKAAEDDIIQQFTLDVKHKISKMSNAGQQKDDVMQNVLGVLPQNQKLYREISEGTFACLQSGNIIDFARVNDNYCDCDDFSDEPSTSACSEGKFFCSQVLNMKNPVSIPSYMVNDGICDCCDGSDEWKNISLPDHVQIPSVVQTKLKIFQVPCKNRCFV